MLKYLKQAQKCEHVPCVATAKRAICHTYCKFEVLLSKAEIEIETVTRHIS